MTDDRHDDRLDDWIPRDLTDDDAPDSQLAAGLLEAMVDELHQLSGTWKQLSKAQQDTSIERLRARLLELTAEAVERIHAAGARYSVVQVDSITVKKEAKATVILQTGKHSAVDRVGRRAVLLFTDPDRFLEGVGDVEGDDDQSDLFPPGSEPPPPPDAEPPQDPGPPGDPEPPEPPPEDPGRDFDDTLPNEEDRTG